MIAFALFPLGVYFLLLALMGLRRRPTVLLGSQDTSLLGFGLVGLVTLGPGKLLIPLDLLAFWGIATWLFWCAFYFIVVYFVSERQTGRIVVYRTSASALIPRLTERAAVLDPRSRFEGNVLHLPALDVQCSLTESAGCVLFQSTRSYRNRDGWRRFKHELDLLCRHSEVPAGRGLVVLWTTFAAGLFIVATIALIIDAPRLIELFSDYWL